MNGSRTKNIKSLSALAILVAVVGLGIGFAAFTRGLSIEGNITVSPTNTFSGNVAFDTATANSTCSCSSGSSCGKGTVAAATITGLTASLKAPGDYCDYTYKVKNTSGYVAYLNAITFANKLTCTASSGTTASLVTATCPYIKAYVQVGGSAFNTTCPSGAVCVVNTSSTKGGNSSIASHTLAKTSGTENVYIRLVYESTTNYADGAFTVYPFGTSSSNKVSLKYDTTD